MTRKYNVNMVSEMILVFTCQLLFSKWLKLFTHFALGQRLASNTPQTRVKICSSVAIARTSFWHQILFYSIIKWWWFPNLSRLVADKNSMYWTWSKFGQTSLHIGTKINPAWCISKSNFFFKLLSFGVKIQWYRSSSCHPFK